MARVGAWKTSKTVPLLAGAGAGIAMAGVAAGIGFGVFQPTGIAANGASATLDALNGLRAGWAWTTSAVPYGDEAWLRWARILGQYGLVTPVKHRVMLAGLTGALAGFASMLATLPYQERYRHGMRHHRGRILREGGHATKAANAVFARGVRSRHSGPGLYLAPGVLMDRMRETEGFFVVGAPGSGKTQWFRFLIEQILARSEHAYRQVKAGVPLTKLPTYPDKVICMDVKGDYTQLWPGDTVMVMAPHDTGKRVVNGVETWIGVAWDIAKDVRGMPAARDFAAAVVEATDEPVWGQAARMIVTGIVYGLQRKHEQDGTWFGWKEIRDVAVLEAKPLRAFLLKWYPPAAKFVIVGKAGPTRTTSSYLANIDTGFYPLVEALAAGWGHYPKDRYLSLRDWFMDEAAPVRSLILQKSMMVEEASNAWMRALIGRAVKFVGSPEFKEDKRRRIWVLMDEFPQIAQKRDGFIKFAEVGRSKGFCPVTGAQVAKQLEETWSAAEMETLEAMSRTKLVFRTEAGSVADHLAEKWIGSSDWERMDVSTNFAETRSRSVSRRVERELVVMASYFAESLGTTATGVRFLLLAGKDVCRLEVPFSTWVERRDGTVSAPWVNDPNYDFTGLGDGAQAGDADEADEGALPAVGAAGGVVIGGIPLPQRSGLGGSGVVAALGLGGAGNPYGGGLLDRLSQAGAPGGALGGLAGVGGARLDALARGPTAGVALGGQQVGGAGGAGVQQPDDGSDDEDE
ncbi:type IV secretion system DNA-binding domain-containing protein [Azospirillum canadense]|uniref:type IV secretion system DNA-binding domain-containing protein n=1 Tax=Azospirillum canadense TaxID=403962 RepID=UPI0022262F83|nr:type IV secretion system DNA-binding domain-containing protein [Azospirillum canadense]MCW2240344.1 hypothetical protein [Azospirillum canadense]